MGARVKQAQVSVLAARQLADACLPAPLLMACDATEAGRSSVRRATAHAGIDSCIDAKATQPCSAPASAAPHREVPRVKPLDWRRSDSTSSSCEI